MFSKKLLISLAIFALLLSPLVVWGVDDKYGITKTAEAAQLDKTVPGELPTLIGKVLGTGLSLVGVLFFALMLYGGLTWMLARGNTEQETKALNTITAAIIGIVIVLASYAITNFVFKSIGPGGGTSSGGGSDVDSTVECTKENNCCSKKGELNCAGKQGGTSCISYIVNEGTEKQTIVMGVCEFYEDGVDKKGQYCLCN